MAPRFFVSMTRMFRASCPKSRRRTITYGHARQADFRPAEVNCGDFSTTFVLHHRGESIGEFRLNVPGEHNVLNATAAVAVATELNVTPDKIREGLALYAGVDRRFQVKGVERGVTVVDDYGHHPTEIRATLQAARSCHPHGIHVLFQPHRFTRTFHLMDDFARAFHQADHVYVLDIYAASEKPMEGVTSEALVERMRQFGHRGVQYVSSIPAGVEEVVKNAESGDFALTLGAGSVSQASESILEALKAQA